MNRIKVAAFNAEEYIKSHLGDRDRENLADLTALIHEFVEAHLIELCTETFELDDTGTLSNPTTSVLHKFHDLYETAYDTRVGINAVCDLIVRKAAKNWLLSVEQKT